LDEDAVVDLPFSCDSSDDSVSSNQIIAAKVEYLRAGRDFYSANRQ